MLFATGFLEILGWFIYKGKNVNRQIEEWSDSLTDDLEYLELESWGQRLHLGKVCQLEGHEAESGALRDRGAGRFLWPEVTRRDHEFGLCYFLWNLCFGKVSFLRMEVKSGRLDGASELPGYCILFLPRRTKVNARFCLPFHQRLKAVRCGGDRFFSLDRQRVFLLLWWMILPPINLLNLLLPVLRRSEGKKGALHHSSWLN